MSKIEDLVGYISFPSGFKLLSEVPLDARYCGEGQEFLQSIVDIGAAYPGLRVFLTDENKFYTYMKNSNNEYSFVLDSIQFTPEQQAVLDSGITAQKVSEFEAKYDKPNTGIPETDLAEGLSDKIDSASSGATQALESIETINSKISLQASASNKLLSDSEVQLKINNGLGRSLSSNAAGDPFTTLTALEEGPWYYGASSVSRAVNDQASVFESGTSTTTIYVYNGTNWVFKSQSSGGLNTEQTQALNAVISSGFTAESWTSSQTKLNGIASGAQVNVLEGVQVNGVDQTISNKKVNISVPTRASDIGAQPTLVSGFNIKTINGNPVLGSGDFDLVKRTGENQTITSGLTLDKSLNLPSVTTWPNAGEVSNTKAPTEKEVEAGINQIAKALISTENIPAGNLEGTVPAANLSGSYNISVSSANQATTATKANKLSTGFKLSASGKITAAATALIDGSPDEHEDPKIINLNVTGLSIEATDLPANITSNTSGNAATADEAAKLTTARKLKVDLSSSTDTTFDGSANVENIPVTGRLTSLSQLPTGAGDGTRRKALVSTTSSVESDIVLALLDKYDVNLGNVLNVEQASKSDFDQLVLRVQDLEQRGLYLGAFNTKADLPLTLLVEDVSNPGTYIRNPKLPNGANTGDFAIVRADEDHSNEVSNYGITNIATDILGTITWQWAYSYHVDMSGKIDKVTGATAADLPIFVTGGGLADSGKKISDFATAAQGGLAQTAVQIVDEGDTNGTIKVKNGSSTIRSVSVHGLGSAAYVDTTAFDSAGTATSEVSTHNSSSGAHSTLFGAKADKVSSATNGNFAGLNSSGNITDSGKKASDFATASQGAKADSAVQPNDIKTIYFGYGDLFKRATHKIDHIINGFLTEDEGGLPINELSASISGILTISDVNNNQLVYGYGFLPKVRVFKVTYDTVNNDYLLEEYSDLPEFNNRQISISGGGSQGVTDITIPGNFGSGNMFLEENKGLLISVTRDDGGKMGEGVSNS